MITNIIFFILGAIISLILYACFLVGKDFDDSINIKEMEEYDE